MGFVHVLSQVALKLMNILFLSSSTMSDPMGESYLGVQDLSCPRDKALLILCKINLALQIFGRKGFIGECLAIRKGNLRQPSSMGILNPLLIFIQWKREGLLDDIGGEDHVGGDFGDLAANQRPALP